LSETKLLFQPTDFCFILLLEIEAINWKQETGGQNPETQVKPGELATLNYDITIMIL